MLPVMVLLARPFARVLPLALAASVAVRAPFEVR